MKLKHVIIDERTIEPVKFQGLWGQCLQRQLRRWTLSIDIFYHLANSRR
jgi:hypothetical protein